jgi:hypothetical protein
MPKKSHKQADSNAVGMVEMDGPSNVRIQLISCLPRGILFPSLPVLAHCKLACGMHQTVSYDAFLTWVTVGLFHNGKKKKSFFRVCGFVSFLSAAKLPAAFLCLLFSLFFRHLLGAYKRYPL